LRTQHGSNIASLWRFGQGSEDPSHLINIVLPGIVANSLVANVPQLVLTQFYLIYSNIYTRKAVAAEWARYAQSPRPLRVTHAQGSQKSSHWLGLPFRYGLLIQIGSALLHWLASQSIFVVSLIFYDYTGQHTLVLNDGTVPDPYSSDKKDAKMSSEVYRTGFSSNAIILAILLGAVLVLFCWIDDLRALPRGMPMVGTCSILISAACKNVPRRSRQGWRDDLVLRPLQWGVIRIEESCAGRGEWATGGSGEVGRGREEAGGELSYCGFTDDADGVVPLVDGELVASDRVVLNNGMTTWRVENEVLDSCTYERDNVSPLGPT